jgi:PAS domain S-box-containing protein
LKKKTQAPRAASAETLRRRLRKSELHLREVKKRYEIAMQALRSQSALTQAIIEQVPGAVFVKDSEGRFTLANRGWSAMSGIPVERALGRTVHDLYPAEVAKRFAAEDVKLLAQGAGAPPIEAVHEGPRQGQFRIVRKAVLSGDDGSAQGLVCTSTDITDLKRAESELADRAKFIGELVDALPVSIALRDTEHRFIRSTAPGNASSICGERTSSASASRPAGLAGNPELLEVAREGEEIDRKIIAGRHGQGAGSAAAPTARSQLPCEPTGLRRQRGRLTAVLATGLDITESTAMGGSAQARERDAADRAKFVGELIDVLPVSIALRDIEGRFLRVNRTWER